jgi:hypothetical protein
MAAACTTKRKWTVLPCGAQNNDDAAASQKWMQNVLHLLAKQVEPITV